MKKEQKYEMINGVIVVEPIDVTPKDAKKKTILDAGGKPTASLNELKQHPFQAKVIAVSENYSNNGIIYPSPIKVGDVLLLRDMSYLKNEKNPPIIIINEKQYVYIKHTDVLGIVR